MDTLEQKNHQDLFHFAQSIFDSWKNLKFDQVRFTQLSGQSNFVYKISSLQHDIQPQNILGKVYGSSASAFVNRDLENKRIKELALKGICPNIYAYNDKLRLEEYIPNTPVKYKDYLDDTKILKIMSQFARLHSIKLKDEQVGVPYIVDFANWNNPLVKKALRDSINTFKLSEDQRGKLSKIISHFTDDAINYIIEIMGNLHYKHVKLCHNDLYYKNLLFSTKGDIYLIDFEYCEYNYPAYDMANFFEQFVFEFEPGCEPPFFREHKENLPSDDRLRLFLKYYVDEFLKSSSISQEEKEQYEKIEIEKLLIDIKLSRVLVTFQWVIWSILMHGNPVGGGDDFLEFAYVIYHLHLDAMKDWKSSIQKV